MYIITILLFAVLLFIIQQDNTLTVSHHTIKSEKIKTDLKIVQLSDLHNKVFLGGNNKIIEKIKAENPDYILITGDITAHNDVRKNSYAVLKQLPYIAPTYYVTGNHEYYADFDTRVSIMSDLRSFGITVLVDESVQLADNFYLTGLDQRSLKDDTLIKLIKALPENSYSLTIAHEPHHFDNYANSGTDLILCGHAHGGQWRLPGIGGLYAPGQGVLPKYTNGMYEKNGVKMIVSRGVGNTTCPVRIFNYPEIVSVSLKSK